MIDRLLNATIFWLSAIGGVFCSYKALITIDVVQNKSTMYSSPFTLESVLVIYLVIAALCFTIGIWFEIHWLRRDRKEAKQQ